MVKAVLKNYLEKGVVSIPTRQLRPDAIPPQANAGCLSTELKQMVAFLVPLQLTSPGHVVWPASLLAC